MKEHLLEKTKNFSWAGNKKENGAVIVSTGGERTRKTWLPPSACSGERERKTAEKYMERRCLPRFPAQSDAGKKMQNSQSSYKQEKIYRENVKKLLHFVKDRVTL
jgi:hypothetical protein